MSFFRYPGGKKKMRDVICCKLDLLATQRPDGFEYREPFFGGGGIGTFLIHRSKVKKVWINDKDLGVACLWTAVIYYPEEMKRLVMGFVPSVEAFDDISNALRTESPNCEDVGSVVRFGFFKMAIHQISYSGLGLKSGGPLGGRDQKSIYKIDCRWSPEYICKKIDEVSRVMRSVEIYGCTACDFSVLIEDDSCEALMYLDPPYYDKGSDLYVEAFTEDDHRRLAELLHTTRHVWLLSYDDCPEVRSLYDWADIETVVVNYSITSKKSTEAGKRESRWKKEVLISPKGAV